MSPLQAGPMPSAANSQQVPKPKVTSPELLQAFALRACYVMCSARRKSKPYPKGLSSIPQALHALLAVQALRRLNENFSAMAQLAVGYEA
eukprot:5763751-Amphidinium_carterae.1